MRRRFQILVALGLVLGCSEVVGVREGIDVSFSISPEEVEPDGELTATLALTNWTGAPQTLRSGIGCISNLRVHESPYGDPVEGTGFPCLSVYSQYTIGPGETRTWSFDIQARTTMGIPLSPGDYHLEAELNVQELDHPVVTFRVVERK